MTNKNEILRVNNLRVSIGGKKIIQGIDFSIPHNSTVVIMGPNGSGKSTLTQALFGHPDYVVKGKIEFQGRNISKLPTEERSRLGMYLAFQNPVPISGVSVANIIHHVQNLKSKNDKKNSVSEFGYSQLLKTAKSIGIDESFLRRGIHEGFSGGERKKMELLQALVFQPSLAVFDEIDTGLDVDALQIVTEGIRLLSENGTSVMIITHYPRILAQLKVDRAIVLVDGKIAANGSKNIITAIENSGYSGFING